MSIEDARLSPNRIPALPKGKAHWNYNEKPSVLALHRRIHKKYGKASAHKCVDCPKQALDWSLDGTVYTDNIEDYSPRCRSCHLHYDMTDERRATMSRVLKKAYAEGRR